MLFHKKILSKDIILHKLEWRHGTRLVSGLRKRSLVPFYLGGEGTATRRLETDGYCFHFKSTGLPYFVEFSLFEEESNASSARIAFSLTSIWRKLAQDRSSRTLRLPPFLQCAHLCNLNRQSQRVKFWVKYPNENRCHV